MQNMRGSGEHMGLVRFLAALAVGIVLGSGAAPAQIAPDQVVQTWYRLILELVRHTPTYSPPVASRAFAYAGVTAFEALTTGAPQMRSLAGQLNGLSALPQRSQGVVYNDAVVLQAALADAAQELFSNTGPTGQRAMAAMAAKLSLARLGLTPAWITSILIVLSGWLSILTVRCHSPPSKWPAST